VRHPFCQIHCPLTNAIPDWLKLTAEGRLEEAYALSASTNAFPEVCGRICPQDRLCEGNCVLEKGFAAVTIGAVETFLTETAFENGWVKAPRPSRELGRSIGIVGSGPAGLAAAAQLRRGGYAVHIYERQDRAGGLLIYGIPNFKLDKSIVARRIALLEERASASTSTAKSAATCRSPSCVASMMPCCWRPEPIVHARSISTAGSAPLPRLII
jgi:glutamate synthase (NADPH/NADH) small chain